MLIVNADDLGRQKDATDNILNCHSAGRISSTSAMVFMEDSRRASVLAIKSGIDVGLHINFSEAFSDAGAPAALRDSQGRIRRFLKSSKYALVLYHPFLTKQFRHTFETQYEEFIQLYGRPPSHFDGHQHMHLATNMLAQRILPRAARVRRSFSFLPGEKGIVNRWYRAAVDRSLAGRHRTTDLFFSLAHHHSTDRLERIVAFAATRNVELMVHPQIPAERDFLLSDGYARIISQTRMIGYDSL